MLPTKYTNHLARAIEKAIDNNTHDLMALRIAEVLKSHIEHIGGLSGVKLTDKTLDLEVLHKEDRQAFCEMVMRDLRRFVGSLRRACTATQYERVVEASNEALAELHTIAYN
jgi:hypothetical protein